MGLPVYNGEAYLEEAMASILAQDFEDFELIVSDNASTDATEDICRRLAGRDSRIRYHRFDHNVGGARNFNHVFEMSSAPYFKWVADDDVHASCHLRRCVEVLDSAPREVALVYPKTVLIDKTGASLGYYEDRMDIRWPHSVRCPEEDPPAGPLRLGRLRAAG
jgi:glycosyltransferase involved in cell wall biosynthesis